MMRYEPTELFGGEVEERDLLKKYKKLMNIEQAYQQPRCRRVDIVGEDGEKRLGIVFDD